jgi:hypothetical protein
MIRTQDVSWYWHRLRAMDGAEIAGRIAEKGRALGERRARLQLEGFRLGPIGPEGARLLPVRENASKAQRAGVAVRAEAIRNGQWTLFGWKKVAMPETPRWDWDAMHDCSAPLDEPAASLDHRHLEFGADPRSIWEINRWSEIVILAQNAWLNGCLADAQTAQRWLRDWVEKNPIGLGINWTSSLEVALRLINFTWVDQMLRAIGDREVLEEQDRLASKIVPEHVWWIWRHRSFGSSANNHLLGELAGLILATRRWPSLIGLACSAENAWQQMQEQVLHQFAADGSNREQALHYHQFAWEMAWQARRVMGGGRPAFEVLMSRAAGYFAAVVHPEEPWDFGDSDDAEVTPLTRDRCRASAEWQGWFQQSQRGESLAFWLGHPPPIEALNNCEWHVFSDSGHAVKRAGAWMGRFDASPLGFGSMAAHGHSDALHVSLWIGDRAVLIDPGTGAYYSDVKLRARLADWRTHNGPVPETGRCGPERMGPFLWTRHHEPPKLSVEGDAAVACFACDGPFVKREVRLIEGQLDVLDRVCNSLPHEVTWVLAPAWSAAPFGDCRFRLIHEDGTRLMLEFEGENALEIERVEVEVSPHFLELRTSSALRLRFTQSVRTRVTVAV